MYFKRTEILEKLRKLKEGRERKEVENKVSTSEMEKISSRNQI